jgi:hypothetical protein
LRCFFNFFVLLIYSFVCAILLFGRQALEKGNAISVGHKLEMTPEMAAGMLERGELTPEQYEDMGYGERLPSYSAANLVVGPRGSNAMLAL